MNTPVDPSSPQFGGMLRDHLADLADEVQPVNLSDRVQASSHRLSVRRAVLTSASVVAAIAVASGAAWAGVQGLSEPHKPPVGASPTAPTTAPSSTAPTASPTPSPPSTSTSGPASSVVPDRSAWNAIPTSLYYLTFDGSRYHLKVWEQGQVREILSPSTAACGLAVSPDRSRVAWTTTDGGGPAGNLVVMRFSDGRQRTVLRGVSCSGGHAPFWLPDSRHMLLARENLTPRVLVNVDTGAVSSTPLAQVREYVAWSPNGRYVAYEANGEIVVARPDGTVVRRLRHADETPTGGFSVQGISDDGRIAVVGMLNSDPEQIRSGFRLVNMLTGRTVSLPSQARPAQPMQVAIYPVPGNQLLARVQGASGYTLYLIGADGKVRAHKAEPPVLATAQLLFTPTP